MEFPLRSEMQARKMKGRWRSPQAALLSAPQARTEEWTSFLPATLQGAQAHLQNVRDFLRAFAQLDAATQQALIAFLGCL
jgi:hypothetical protein